MATVDWVSESRDAVTGERHTERNSSRESRELHVVVQEPSHVCRCGMAKMGCWGMKKKKGKDNVYYYLSFIIYLLIERGSIPMRMKWVFGRFH